MKTFKLDPKFEDFWARIFLFFSKHQLVVLLPAVFDPLFLKSFWNFRFRLNVTLFWQIKMTLFCNMGRGDIWSIHSGPENLKKSRPKILVKSNNSISRKKFLTKFHFLQFQKWPKINFMIFLFIYLISRGFLPGLF